MIQGQTSQKDYQGRIAPITATAGVATFALFYLMQGLVAADQVLLMDEPPIFHPDIFDTTPPVEPVRDNHDVPKPTEPLPPPPIPRPLPTNPTGPTWNPDPIARPAPPEGPAPTLMDTDGEMIPLVRVQPNYPTNALNRGIEGWVVVEFTVDPYGSVVNPVVIDAEPKNTFDRATLQAIAKFKYKPAMIDGQPKATKGVRFRMVYSLEGAE